MARHFLDTYGELDRQAVPDRLRRKHQAGTPAMLGRAPGELTIRMGSRVYSNDRLVKPAFDEAALEEDPWAVGEAGRPGDVGWIAASAR